MSSKLKRESVESSESLHSKEVGLYQDSVTNVAINWQQEIGQLEGNNFKTFEEAVQGVVNVVIERLKLPASMELKSYLEEVLSDDEGLKGIIQGLVK
jgi:hypothetical protein